MINKALRDVQKYRLLFQNEFSLKAPFANSWLQGVQCLIFCNQGFLQTQLAVYCYQKNKKNSYSSFSYDCFMSLILLFKLVCYSNQDLRGFMYEHQNYKNVFKSVCWFKCYKNDSQYNGAGRYYFPLKCNCYRPENWDNFQDSLLE